MCGLFWLNKIYSNTIANHFYQKSTDIFEISDILVTIDVTWGGSPIADRTLPLQKLLLGLPTNFPAIKNSKLTRIITLF